MPGIIDVHAHYRPRRYVERLEQLRAAGLPPGTAFPASVVPSEDPAQTAERLARMDQAGVDLQVLSPAIAAPYLLDEAKAVEAARLCNDEYAALVDEHPGRLAAFVSLPLPHVDASLAELARGLDELGAIGVTMNCSVFDRSTAEDEFAPLYQEMDRRGAVLFFHPCFNGLCSPLINDYGLESSVGSLLEDSLIGLQLVVKQVPQRYPNIEMIIPHLGGILPMALDRLDRLGSTKAPDLAEPMSRTLRRFHYDTVGHGSKAALRCACEAFGADRLLPGSDYPVLLAFESYRQTFAYIERADLPPGAADQILYHNAQRLLRR